MKRFAPLPLLFLLALPLTGCIGGGGEGSVDFRPNAVGREATVQVVMDSMLWVGPVGQAVRNELGFAILTLPGIEPHFDLTHRQFKTTDDLEYIKKQKNVIVVAPLDQDSNEGQFMRSSFAENAQNAVRGGQTAAIQRANLWRRNQMVYFVTAADENGLIDALQERSADIRYAFDTMIRNRTELDLFEKKRQVDKEEAMMEKHGFAIKVQHDYLTAVDTTNFIWLRRILTDSWRSIFIYYIDNVDPTELDAQWILDTRDALTRQYMEGNIGGYPEIDRIRPVLTENINFLERFSFETRGLWRMMGEEDGKKIQYGGGGPFVNYTFYDEPTRRLYMIDGMVFAPGFPKREFLRHMETMAYTFRTRGDVAAAAVAAR